VGDRGGNVRENWATGASQPLARKATPVHRRSFLIGGATGLTLVAVSACTGSDPEPDPSPVPAPSALPVPEPAAMARSSWSTDPFALGAFSYLGVGSTPAQREALGRPVAGRVFFAGEATSVTLPGTVAGAWDSGTRAADEISAVAGSGERIAIIGAGAAGAAAAKSLSDAGFEVTVLEARDRVGGRIDTVSADDWAIPVELGAGCVDSETAPGLVVDLGRLDIEVQSLGDSVSVRTADGIEVEKSGVGADTVRAAVAAAALLPGDVTIARALEQLPPTAENDGDPVGAGDRLQSYLRGDVAIRFGADVDQLSARFGLDDGQRTADSVVLGGFQLLVTDALDGIPVWTSNVVSELAYGDDGVSIRFATGESLQVDRVVVTVPLGVLKSRDIRFDPQLPLSHLVATTGIEMGTVDKVWLRFDEAFWDTDAVRWSVVGGDLDITEWVNLTEAAGSPLLIGLVGGDRAAAVAELGDEELVAMARASLAPFLPA